MQISNFYGSGMTISFPGPEWIVDAHYFHQVRVKSQLSSQISQLKLSADTVWFLPLVKSSFYVCVVFMMEGPFSLFIEKKKILKNYIVTNQS